MRGTPAIEVPEYERRASNRTPPLGVRIAAVAVLAAAALALWTSGAAVTLAVIVVALVATVAVAVAGAAVLLAAMVAVGEA